MASSDLKEIFIPEKIASAVLIFYILLVSNQIEHILPKWIKKELQNRLVLHMIGFLIMSFLVVYVGEVKHPYIMAVFTVGMYLWFMITTKLSMNYFVPVMFLLLVVFITDGYKRGRYGVSGEIDQATEERIKNTETFEYILLSLAFLISIIGFVSSLKKKKVEISFFKFVSHAEI